MTRRRSNGGSDAWQPASSTRWRRSACLGAGIARQSHQRAAEGGREPDMNLVVWLPAMFLVGLVGMGLCLAFVIACEKI
jgi:hypothetical protein